VVSFTFLLFKAMLKKCNRLVGRPLLLCRCLHLSSRVSTAAIKNYYEVLGCKRDASRRDIKMAYYKLSKQLHPDVNRESGAEDRFKAVQEAYDVLGDERRRADYDISTGEGFYEPSMGSSSSSSSSSSNSNARNWKRRTSGPVYSGRSDTYDFDEHFRGHYGSNEKIRKPSPQSASFSSTRFTNERDFENYWRKKESQHDDDLKHRFDSIIRNTLIASVLMCFFFVSLYTAKQREESIIKQRLIEQQQSANNNRTRSF
jgi:curved DNA-binding protein CbpA